MTKYVFHSEKTKTTCKECSKHDGRVYYDIKDIPELPIHPNCKCWIEVVEDSKEKGYCDCKDVIMILQNGIVNVYQNTENLLDSIDSKAIDTEILFEEIARLLENLYIEKEKASKEIGVHKKDCKNNVDGVIKEIEQYIINLEKLNKKEENLSDLLYSLRREVFEFLKEVQNKNTDIEVLTEFIGEEINHTVSECKAKNQLNSYSKAISKISKKINDFSISFKELKTKIKEVEEAIKASQKCIKIIEEKKQSPCGCRVLNVVLKGRVEENASKDEQKEKEIVRPKTKEEISKDNAYFSDETLKKARKFIQGEEGFSAEAYQDTAGIWTIGYGHTGEVDGKPITKGMRISKEKAEELYRKDFESHSAMLSTITVPLSENQKIALASLIYNAGASDFINSKLYKKLQAGDIKGAADELDDWVNITNPKTGEREVSESLVNRRKREKELFLTPDK